MNVLEWMDSLEAFQVIIYRRPNFLSPDFEFESYIGSGELRNIFHEKRVDDTKESITLVFPERWINCSECHQLLIKHERRTRNKCRHQGNTHHS